MVRVCACCGAPFAVDPGPGSLCAFCLARPPAYARARAILAYDEKSRGAILALKHADRLDLVPGFSRWLDRVGGTLIAESDVIVPVPLHRSRLWMRRYNQSAELARRGAGLVWSTGWLLLKEWLSSDIDARFARFPLRHLLASATPG